MMNSKELLKKALNLPSIAGCYLMKNVEGKILYIGKANNLRRRVSSYFKESKTTQSDKTSYLVEKIYDFDFIITNSDADALVLENNLIKKYSPKYNVSLKDDKSYPYIVVDMSEDFPRPQFIRRPVRKDFLKLYGPFPSGGHLGKVLRIVMKSFNLRDCSPKEFQNRKNPCLLYQMKQCSAPCVGLISKENYFQDLQFALNIFRGKGEKSLKVLKERMFFWAEKEEFERATILRDGIIDLEDFLKKSMQQNAQFLDVQENVDVISYFEGEQEVDLVIYMIRDGLLLGHKTFFLSLNLYWEEEQTLSERLLRDILQYYKISPDSLPDFIIFPFCSQVENENFYLALKELRNEAQKIKVISESQRYRDMIELAKRGAKEAHIVRKEQRDKIFLALTHLKELLLMSARPKTIEAYDIAIWQGQSPTASKVVFEEGKPLKEHYRYYNLTQRPEGNNDVAMIEEVLRKRFKEQETFLPDLLLIDGGRAQLNRAYEVLKELGHSIPVVSIAKAKQAKKTQERLMIYGRKNPFYLEQDPGLFRLITQMRDESHRFCRKLHHKKEKKRVLQSLLDGIPGIGPKKKMKIFSLLRENLLSLSPLSAEELALELKISLSSSQILKTKLNQLRT